MRLDYVGVTFSPQLGHDERRSNTRLKLAAPGLGEELRLCPGKLCDSLHYRGADGRRRRSFKRIPLGGPINIRPRPTMATSLVSRLSAALLLNIPLAWLMMTRGNRRAAEEMAIIATGGHVLPSTHGYGLVFSRLLVVTLFYVILVEAVAFLLRAAWRHCAGEPTSRLTSA